MREHADKAKEQGSWGVVIIVLLAVIVTYFLSCGPVIAAAFKMGVTDGSGMKVLQTVYAPIGWLHDNTFLRDPIDHYLDWWFDVFGVKPYAP